MYLGESAGVKSSERCRPYQLKNLRPGLSPERQGWGHQDQTVFRRPLWSRKGGLARRDETMSRRRDEVTQNMDIALEMCYGHWDWIRGMEQWLRGLWAMEHLGWILSKLTSRKRVWDKASRKEAGDK